MLKNRIKSLISLIENTEIEEIEVTSFWGAQKIKLSKNKPNKNLVDLKTDNSMYEVKKDFDAPISKPSKKEDDKINLESESTDNITDEIENKINLEEDVDCYEIKAPLVGTYYSSPKPSDPPFVNVGDTITKGQVICIIEAMKIFNDIEAEISGKVHEICVDNGNPVEYDQVIIKILPE